jgi:hypothetical protein
VDGAHHAWSLEQLYVARQHGRRCFACAFPFPGYEVAAPNSSAWGVYAKNAAIAAEIHAFDGLNERTKAYRAQAPRAI